MIEYPFPPPKDGGWDGAAVVLVASGPSAREANLAAARGLAHFVVINTSWRLAPWADIAYGHDWRWWASDEAPRPEQFDGVVVGADWPNKVEWEKLNQDQRDQLSRLHRIKVRQGTGALIWDKPDIRGGGNSAIQMVNVLARLGVKKIMLSGVDCGDPEKRWHGRHKFQGAALQDEGTMRQWREQWSLIAPDLRNRGIEVINCSLTSKVSAFPILSMTEAAAQL